MKIKLQKHWPYLIILIVTSVYFVYILNDSRYFFVDDFTGFTFSVPRTYWQIIIDSLASRNVDRHKFVGYLITKWLYHNVGTEVSHYFFVQYIIHTINSFLVFRILKRVTKKTYVSFLLAVVYSYRFYLSWFSNIHVMAEGFFSFLFINTWLSYLEKAKKVYLLFLFPLYLLAVFSYGPAFLFAISLIPISFYIKEKKAIHYIKVLIPILVSAPLYFFVFTFTQDSLARFQETTNPYRGDFSIIGLLKSHSIYLSTLSIYSHWTQIATFIFWVGLTILTLKAKKKTFLWLISFGVSIAANSFFPQHTMFYYLYVPVIFLLVYFAINIEGKYVSLFLLLFFLLFNPFHQLYQVAFRLKHPAKNFEKESMAVLLQKTNQAITNGDTEIQLSNWEITPNLQHAIDYQALPLFLSNQKKNDFLYSYSRETQRLTMTPINK